MYGSIPGSSTIVTLAMRFPIVAAVAASAAVVIATPTISEIIHPTPKAVTIVRGKIKLPVLPVAKKPRG